MPKSKILVVEDEKDLARLLRYNLEKEGFRLLVAGNGETGLQMALNHPETPSPAPTAPTSNPSLDQMLFTADASDEAVSLINALAEKLGLGAKTAPPRAPGPKRPTQ